ncbi:MULTISPECIES: hypothetical protein [Pseudomonas]|uniref:hypothetical protein n=1 Tax=Pseudomonas TaxID=286 RepID=UPI0012F88F1F|nr:MULTISPECIES: hypothetical protein [Pseudomonas]MDC7827904.1 hypothetical protein [Pseudomonas benzopyrenica]
MGHLKITILALLCSTPFSIYATEQSPDIRDSVEARLLDCIKSNFSKSCWLQTFQGKIVPWLKEKEKPVLIEGEKHWQNWLDGRKVFDVYKVESVEKAQIFDSRAYIVERDDGEVAGLVVGFRRATGNWYVSDLKSDNTKAFLDKIISTP